MVTEIRFIEVPPPATAKDSEDLRFSERFSGVISGVKKGHPGGLFHWIKIILTPSSLSSETLGFSPDSR
jgi:hypothetical protein